MAQTKGRRADVIQCVQHAFKRLRLRRHDDRYKKWFGQMPFFKKNKMEYRFRATIFDDDSNINHVPSVKPNDVNLSPVCVSSLRNSLVNFVPYQFAYNCVCTYPNVNISHDAMT